MGMFDTIIFPKPIACATCGKLHEDTQTKLFENTMTNYFLGDIVPTTVIHGIIEETLVCDHDSDDEKYSFDQKVYFVIWHGILIDVVSSVENARKKLDSFGLGDLFFLYQSLYKERNDFQAKYSRLRHWIKSYYEFQQLSEDEQLRIKNNEHKLMDFGYFTLLPYLKKDDPLLSFLKELDGPTLPVLLTLAFALFEGSLLFILAIMTRKLNRPIVHYLPAFIVLITISSILEVSVL